VEDLISSGITTTNILLGPIENPATFSLSPELSGPIASVGELNTAYQPVTVSDIDFGLSGGIVSLSFIGFTNMPFAVWASGDLVNWTPAGTLQPSPGQFQFNDLAASNYPARFYQLRLP
jgi:hypothetical protein